MGTHKYGYVLIDSSAASPHYCVRHPSNSCWVIAFLVKMASLSVFKLLVVALLLSTLLSVDCSARLNSKRQKRVPIKPSSKGNNKFSNVNLPTDTSTVGFDTVASLNQTVLTCLVAQASVATFQAVNGLDIVAAVNATAAAARSAGFTTVDALLSPCPLCSVNATAQASRFAQYVTKSKLSVDNYWVSVTNQKWSNDTSTNTAFLQSYLTSILSLPKSGSVGILTSSPIWSRVTGGSTSFTNISGSTIMLWYATVDNQPNYTLLLQPSHPLRLRPSHPHLQQPSHPHLQQPSHPHLQQPNHQLRQLQNHQLRPQPSPLLLLARHRLLIFQVRHRRVTAQDRHRRVTAQDRHRRVTAQDHHLQVPPRLDPHRLRDRRIHIHTVELIPTVTVIHTLTVAPIPTVTATLLNLTATVDKLTAIQLIPDRILLLTLANILTLVHTLEPIHPVARTRQLDLIPQVILAVDHTLRVVPTLVVSVVLDRVRKR